LSSNERIEVSEVAAADAVRYPGTVMIKSVDALIAQMAMTATG